MIIALSIFFMSIFWMSAITTSVLSVDRSDIPEALKANYAGPFLVSTSHSEWNHMLSSRM